MKKYFTTILFLFSACVLDPGYHGDNEVLIEHGTQIGYEILVGHGTNHGHSAAKISSGQGFSPVTVICPPDPYVHGGDYLPHEPPAYCELNCCVWETFGARNWTEEAHCVWDLNCHWEFKSETVYHY